jgi:pyruvate dehydrogenase E1 component alpha subunit
LNARRGEETVVAQRSDPARRLQAMLRIRRFEEQVLRMGEAKAFPGHYHVYIGQEATAVAACEPLTAEDMIFTTWRNHGHLLARGASPERMMAEIFGRATGYCGGKSGSLHLSAAALGIPATSAMVGGSLPLAVGAALGLKQRRSAGIVVAFFGDAALDEGAAYEAFNLAALWAVPILFVCENNSIPPHLRKRGQFTSSSLSAAEVRARRAPHFVEVRCTRWPGNTMTWPELIGGECELDWAFGVRPQPAELATWVEGSDPVLHYLRSLVEAGALARDTAVEIDARVRGEMAAAARFAQESPWPDPAEALRGVYAEGRPPCS